MSCITIFATQRSGTTVLRDTLSKTRNFYDYSEIFHDHAEGSKYNFFNFLSAYPDMAVLHSHPTRENIEILFNKYFDFLQDNCPKNCFFIDIKYNSSHHFDLVWHDPLSKPYIIDLLAAHNVPILHIKRNNLFAQVLSGIVAARMGKWHFSSNEKLNSEKFQIDPKSVLTGMLRLEKLYGIYDDYLSDYPKISQISYEEMFLDNRISIEAKQEIERLSGLTLDENLKLSLQKINSSLSSRISNLEEIQEFFSGNQFEKFVAEALKSEEGNQKES